MDEHIRRRIRFLILEASSDAPVRDMAIRMIERCVSNYATIGQGSGTSFHVKKVNAWMSKAAYEAAMTLEKYRDWHNLTTNEHEQELIDCWRELRERREQMSEEDVLQLFSKPFVTILKTENVQLRTVSSARRTTRYAASGIVVGKAVGLWKRGRRAVPPPEWVARNDT